MRVSQRNYLCECVRECVCVCVCTYVCVRVCVQVLHIRLQALHFGGSLFIVAEGRGQLPPRLFVSRLYTVRYAPLPTPPFDLSPCRNILIDTLVSCHLARVGGPAESSSSIQQKTLHHVTYHISLRPMVHAPRRPYARTRMH